MKFETVYVIQENGSKKENFLSLGEVKGYERNVFYECLSQDDLRLAHHLNNAQSTKLTNECAILKLYDIFKNKTKLHCNVIYMLSVSRLLFGLGDASHISPCHTRSFRDNCRAKFILVTSFTLIYMWTQRDRNNCALCARI